MCGENSTVLYFIYLPYIFMHLIMHYVVLYAGCRNALCKSIPQMLYVLVLCSVLYIPQISCIDYRGCICTMRQSPTKFFFFFFLYLISNFIFIFSFILYCSFKVSIQLYSTKLQSSVCYVCYAFAWH